ncbi:hypothetical protein RRG08_042962 [Elysia crispata]|uniref:Uncharacterized protein n=1 Tax=Elysia crispata TaxID=231223 RepID=A0AAE1AXM1_9GAST|nr:hypothetical protein RRG08_042962 [Elysia crispata]
MQNMSRHLDLSQDLDRFPTAEITLDRVSTLNPVICPDLTSLSNAFCSTSNIPITYGHLASPNRIGSFRSPLHFLSPDQFTACVTRATASPREDERLQPRSAARVDEDPRSGQINLESKQISGERILVTPGQLTTESWTRGQDRRYGLFCPRRL